MKIAIPIDEDKKAICASFGRAPYFVIHDTEAETSKIETNPAAETASGAGLKAAQFVMDAGVDALITARCGQNAADVFKAAGVRIYKAMSTNADENLKAMNKGRLDELTTFHAGFHGKQ